MKTKEQVIEWLKSKEWFEQFKANVEKVHSVERFLDWFYDYTLFLLLLTGLIRLKVMPFGIKNVVNL